LQTLWRRSRRLTSIRNLRCYA